MLVLDDDPRVRPSNIFVMSGVHGVGAINSTNDPVVTNDHNIHIYRLTWTMATGGYSNRTKQGQKLKVSAKRGQEKAISDASTIEGV